MILGSGGEVVDECLVERLVAQGKDPQDLGVAGVEGLGAEHADLRRARTEALHHADDVAVGAWPPEVDQGFLHARTVLEELQGAAEVSSLGRGAQGGAPSMGKDITFSPESASVIPIGRISAMEQNG